MTGTVCNRRAVIALAAVLLQLSATQLHAQQDSYNCVMEAKSTIELQSAEDGILDRVLVGRGQRVKAGEIVAGRRCIAMVVGHARAPSTT